MIVLFNTAFRIGYLRNVLRTIFLPVGAPNRYRYSVGEHLHVSPQTTIHLKGRIGETILVCFGDRFAPGGYRFIPIRKAILEKVEESGGRIYLSVRMAGHISSSSVVDFTKRVYEIDSRLGLGMLRLTGDDPQNSQDGRYVVELPTGDFEEFLEENEFSWSASVRELSQARAFQEQDRKFVFAKTDLVVDGLRRSYNASGGRERFVVERDADARLMVSYIFPAQNVDAAASAKLEVLTPPGMQLLGPSEHYLDMPENQIDIPFAFENESRKRYFTLDLKFAAVSDGDNVVGPEEAVAFEVHETGWRLVIALVCVAVYVCGAMIASEGSPAFGELLKGIGLVGVFLSLGGRKIV